MVQLWSASTQSLIKPQLTFGENSIWQHLSLNLGHLTCVVPADVEQWDLCYSG